MENQKNYVYIATTNDKYEYIVAMADSMNSLSQALGLNASSVSKRLSEHKKNKDMRAYNTYKIERVKICDFVYLICKDLKNPFYVSRDLNTLSNMSGYKIGTLQDPRYMHQYEDNMIKEPNTKGKVKQFKDSSILLFVDLLDLDTNLARYLESCIDKGKITTSFE